jgi:ribose transport system substrate-binding protein
MLAATACGGGGSSSSSQGGGVKLNPADLATKGIVGHGPNGETAATLDAVQLSDADATKAKAGHYKVAIVMQTMDIDWSTNQVRGITDTLQKYGAEVIGVVDPHFKVNEQIAALENMIQRHPDAIISIPVDDTATAATYKKVSQAGIKLILMDNPPRGLKYPQDYQSLVSSDNQGDGLVAAHALSQYVPKNGTVGIIHFGVDFFVTNERANGFRNWMKANRPDVKIKQADFLDPNQAGSVAANFLTANPDVKGLFGEWEVPSLGAASAMRGQGKNIPIASINLSGDTAVNMAQGGLVKGVGAQLPYDQGEGEALAAINALLGKQPPAWIALAAEPVVPSNVPEGYKKVFHTDPPATVVNACKTSKVCTV